MAWLNSLRKEERAISSSPVPSNSIAITRPYFSNQSTAGQEVTPSTALTDSAVYACARVLSTTIAALSLSLYRRNWKGKARETAQGHHLFSILHDRPNEYMTSFQWVSTKVMHLCVAGNAYSQIVRDNNLRVVGLYPLQPNRMKIWIAPDTAEIFYEYTKADGMPRYFERSEINHWIYQTLDGISGMNPIEYARNTIGKSLARDEFESNQIRNGGTPAGVLKFPQKMTEAGMKNIRASWEAMHGGSRNAGKVAILDNGLEFEPITISNVDLQWAELAASGPLEICQYYGVPPHMIHILDRATFSNITDQQIQFRQHTILPMCGAIEQCIERDLLMLSDKKNYFAEFNLDTLERASRETRINGYARSLQWGIMTRNEARSLENMELLAPEVGDVVLSPLNMVPAELAVEMARKSIENKSKPGHDQLDPNQAPKPSEDPAKADQIDNQGRSKHASKRAIADAFARISNKERRKIEQIKGKPDFDTKMTTFYSEQRDTFVEMLLPSILLSQEMLGEVTPSVEMRSKRLAERMIDKFIDHAVVGVDGGAACGELAIIELFGGVQ